MGETSGIRPDMPLQYMHGVGPRLAEAFARLNLFTVQDLLWHIPRRWEDRTRFLPVARAAPGEYVTLCGIVVSAATTRPKPKLPLTRAILHDQNGDALVLLWFNQPYLEKTLRALVQSRQPIVVYGQLKRSGFVPEMLNPEWEAPGSQGDTLSANRIVPVYPAAEGLTQRTLRKLVHLALQGAGDYIENIVPDAVRSRYGLMPCRQALQVIHFPPDMHHQQQAQRSLAFEEFFLLQTLLAQRRAAEREQTHTLRMKVDAAQLEQDMREIVPFQLTSAQQRVIREIGGDMAEGRVMNRLLQGDVGSGKTMVALAALLIAVQNGFQGAIMAPTEILAQQHCIVMRKLLEPLGIPVELAIGSLTEKEKRQARQNLFSGQSRIAVGTHALIQEDVEFARLGLVVVDEQHRFGVLQRKALSQKGEKPHVLVMTATPIPRTLTMTLYGDLDVSLLNQLPPGRKPVVTHWRSRSKRPQVYQGIQKLLQAGRQAYVVCPLVEESESLQAKSAVALHKEISEELLPGYRAGLLHGRMKPDEKEDVMARFKAGELDVLVATTVIEVGIDVPNACAIVIEDADRFGLAQLHQLRGRVGRGAAASYCVLIADPKTEEAQARMEIMTQTADGFRIAEEDLQLRGPGEFYGIRQSGMPEMRVGDLLRDRELLAEAREAAKMLVECDPQLSLPENAALRRALQNLRQGLEMATVS